MNPIQRRRNLFSGVLSFVDQIISNFQERISPQGATIEAISCVNTRLNELNNQSLLSSATFVLVPSGYKSGSVYAQLPNNGNGDLTYTRATTATRVNSAGVIESVASGVPPIDYSLGGCPVLLLEPQRTNSLRNSSAVGVVVGTPGSLPTNYGYSTSGLSIQIVATGTENGLNYFDVRFFGTASGVNQRIDFETSTQITAATGQNWNLSCYAKIVANPNPFTTSSLAMFENTSGGVFVTAGSGSIVLDSTLKLFNYQRTLNGGATIAAVRPNIQFNTVIGSTYDFTVRIAAPQMELGAYGTSFIPTTTVAATRNAGNFSRNNIYTNGLIGASGGTWLIELKNNLSLIRDAGVTYGLALSDNAGNNGMAIWNVTGNSASRMSIRKTIGGVGTTLSTFSTLNNKIAIKWDGSTADIFVNGTKVVTATAFNFSLLEFLRCTVEDAPKYIQQMALWNTPLSDTQCINLTT